MCSVGEAVLYFPSHRHLLCSYVSPKPLTNKAYAISKHMFYAQDKCRSITKESYQRNLLCFSFKCFFKRAVELNDRYSSQPGTKQLDSVSLSKSYRDLFDSKRNPENSLLSIAFFRFRLVQSVRRSVITTILDSVLQMGQLIFLLMRRILYEHL